MDPILIPILGVFIPIVVVPASLIFKFYKYKRECEHLERMKALEVGRTLRETSRGGRHRGPSWRSGRAYLWASLAAPGLPPRLVPCS